MEKTAKTKSNWLLIWLLAAVAIAGGYLGGTVVLKGEMEKWIADAVGRPVQIDVLQGTFPPGITAKGITLAQEPDAANLPFAIHKVIARFSFLSLLRGQFGLDVELISPVISMERSSDGTWRLPVNARSAGGGRGGLPVVRLRVRDAEITIIDKFVSPEAMWFFRKVSLSAKREAGGLYMYTFLSALEGLDRQPVGQVGVTGSVSFKEQAAEAHLSADYSALEFLAPYIQLAIGAAPSRGTCSINSAITVRGREFSADTKFIGKGILFAMEQPTALGPSGNRLVELLKDREGRVHLTFTIAGKLGEQMDWSGLITGTVREAMRQAMARSIQKVLGSSETNVGESVQKGVESLGR
ncbi:MAG: DUF748 domain-containing protein [Candidatus Omnitrophica bacterium]|nr:DUF748 domain-containing protein [Candidatus Omnitrophota bacterium]